MESEIFIVNTRFTCLEKAKMNDLESLFVKYGIAVIDTYDYNGRKKVNYVVKAMHDQLTNLMSETSDIEKYRIPYIITMC